MKSTMRRPSENRPAGAPKWVSPLGKGAWPNAADRPPVSEFESPKLKTAGNLQGLRAEDDAGLRRNDNENNSAKLEQRSVGQKWGSI